MGCVIWALKAHFINISETLPDREEIIEALTGKQSPLCYTRPIRQSLLQQAIVVPDMLRDEGMTIRDMGELEKSNEVPIVVYYLDYTATPKQRKTREQAIKTKAKRGGDPYDPDHYMHDVSLTCIRAPSQKILSRYDKPPCHLLMIGPRHVCYIPNIQAFMLQVFDGAWRDMASIKDANMRRCPLCFGLLRDQTHLLSHLKSGICYKNASQPPAVILPPKGMFLNYQNITLGETPELQVIIDSEARLVARTPQEKQRYVADDVNDDVTVPDHDGEEEEEEEEWVDMGQDATDCDEDGSKDVVLTNEEKEEKQEKEEEEMETCGRNSDKQ